MKDESLSRRQFVQTTAGATAGLMLSSRLAAMPSSAPEVIKVGVIGCGGRGTGAARDCMRGNEGVQIVAMGDLMPDRLASATVERVDMARQRSGFR